MAKLVVLAAAGLLLASTLLAGAAEVPRREQIVVVSGPEGHEDLYLVDPTTHERRRLTRDAASDRVPAFSPDGERIAFASNRASGGTFDLYSIRSHGGELTRLTRSSGLDDSSPSWSPDGRRIVFTSGEPGARSLYVVGAGGGRVQRLSVGPGESFDPDWSPDGRRIVFASTRAGNAEIYVVLAGGGEARRVTYAPGEDTTPVWSPNGRRIAFADGARLYAIDAFGGTPQAITTGGAGARTPAYSPDGGQIAYISGGDVFAVGSGGADPRRLTSGPLVDADPDWGMPPPLPPPPAPPAPAADELLPDLEQRSPRNLILQRDGRRVLLGFDSAVDNIGEGPLWIRASRPSRLSPTMAAEQLVRTSDGKVRRYGGAGVVRYTYTSSHSHWHLLNYESFELRRAADFKLIVRDRKSGFCLADHYGHAAQRVRGFRPPVYLGNCNRGHPEALTVDQGTSIGYTDRYPAHFHGQNVEITGLHAARYWLVHRVNPEGRWREQRMYNNAASVLLRLSWQRVEIAKREVRAGTKRVVVRVRQPARGKRKARVVRLVRRVPVFRQVPVLRSVPVIAVLKTCEGNERC